MNKKQIAIHTMIASFLPIEILETIFHNLGGRDVQACGLVCRRWAQAVAGLGEKFWSALCAREHGAVYADAHRKACLSWRQLHAALSAWADVAAADVTVYQLVDDKTECFHTLENSVLSFARPSADANPDNPYNAIVYYNLATKQEQHRENYEPFNRYAENDLILVIDTKRADDRLVQVMAKADRKQCKQLTVDTYRPWLLYKTELFYERSYEDYGEFSHVKLVEQDNKVTLEDRALSGEVGGDLEDVVYVNNELNVFKTYDGYMSILRLRSNSLQSLCDIESIDENVTDPLEVIRQHGFVWSTPRLYYWLSFRYDNDERFKKYDIGTAYTYGKIVIVGTRVSLQIHVFYNPYGLNGNLELHKATPILTIDMKQHKSNDPELDECIYRDPGYNYIGNIDVIETEGGHNIVVLYCRKIFVIELTHRICGKDVVATGDSEIQP